MAKAPTEIRSLARQHTKSALKVLAGIMNESEAPHSARVAAATALLDRGWGKPDQRYDAEVVHRYVAHMPEPIEDTAEWEKQHSPTRLQ